MPNNFIITRASFEVAVTELDRKMNFYQLMQFNLYKREIIVYNLNRKEHIFFVYLIWYSIRLILTFISLNTIAKHRRRVTYTPLSTPTANPKLNEKTQPSCKKT